MPTPLPSSASAAPRRAPAAAPLPVRRGRACREPPSNCSAQCSETEQQHGLLQALSSAASALPVLPPLPAAPHMGVHEVNGCDVRLHVAPAPQAAARPRPPAGRPPPPAAAAPRRAAAAARCPSALALCATSAARTPPTAACAPATPTSDASSARWVAGWLAGRRAPAAPLCGTAEASAASCGPTAPCSPAAGCSVLAASRRRSACSTSPCPSAPDTHSGPALPRLQASSSPLTYGPVFQNNVQQSGRCQC